MEQATTLPPVIRLLQEQSLITTDKPSRDWEVGSFMRGTSSFRNDLMDHPAVIDNGNNNDSPADSSRLRHFGFLAQPRHFKASFRVRGPERQSAIQREWKDSVKDTDEILDGITAKLASQSY